MFASLLNKVQMNSSEKTYSWKGYIAKGSQQEVTKVVRVVKNRGKTLRYTN